MQGAGPCDARNEAWEKWKASMYADLHAATDAVIDAGLLPEEG